MDIDFIRKKFREYYLKKSSRIEPPLACEQREFGFIPFKKEKSMIRHKGFENAAKMNEFLIDLTPSDAYYSSAYYTQPAEEKMKDKIWLGADLIFDIDCDHLFTLCKQEHDKWRCINCGKTGLGTEPARCPQCGGERLEAETWICERCLEAAKHETLKLTSMLEEDFGLPAIALEAVFSGHRGYHLHVEHLQVKKLGAGERKEIVDYVTSTGLNLELHSSRQGGVETGTLTLDISAPGWRGRMSRSLYTLLLKSPQELRQLGLREEAVRSIKARREELLEQLDKGIVTGVRWIRSKTWKEILAQAARAEAASIDTVVTTDVHRLIRLPSTLHGKTGFKAVRIHMNELDEFKPLENALAFTEGTLALCLSETPAIRIGGEIYGPYSQDTEAELPMAAAMFFLCKGKAMLSRNGC